MNASSASAIDEGVIEDTAVGAIASVGGIPQKTNGTITTAIIPKDVPVNIHLGLFFVSSAFFAGIAYLFDPVFERIGYALLTSEGLNGLWTVWYNIGLMRLSYFNNTF